MDDIKTEKEEAEKNRKANEEDQDQKMDIEPEKDLMQGQSFQNEAEVESKDVADAMRNMENELAEMVLYVKKEILEISKAHMELMKMMVTRYEECREKSEKFEQMFEEYQNCIKLQ